MRDFAALLDAVRGLRWPARTAVRSGIPGAHGSRMRGISTEFAEHRAYSQGDDRARIDWRLFARTDRAHIRLSNDRAILPTTIVLDASASMDFPVATHGKWRLATELAIGLAAVARGAADPVGLVVVRESQSIRLPPRSRHGVIHEMIRAIGETEPGGSESLLPALAAAARAGERVVIISDFLSDADDLLDLAARIVTSGGELHALHVVAPEELDPPRDTVLVADPESPEIRRTLTGDARRAYVSAFAAWRDTLAHDWSDAGIAYTLAVTGAETTDHLVRRVTAPRGAAAGA
ncbi:MAG: hypothetical protein JWL95_529 [Gemmatimonadetes bacterium]|nr:hypothetical protein [Gemmatimonadota bacterium]